ncbi:T9SS type A sorting domain-containing protein [Candidatus Poribacteria bacterium]|nr:T9SS type A sorting domain-containing protein [Candidatus Poribacteria bacterium]
MRNFKKITFGIFILPLLLIFQSMSYAETLTKSVTYHYKLAPFGEGVDWEKYLPSEDASLSVYFEFQVAPPQLDGEINGAITFDPENQTLSVQPKPVTKTDEHGNEETFVGKFSSKGGIIIRGDIVLNLDFDLPFFVDNIEEIKDHRIPIFGNAALEYADLIPIIGKTMANLKNIDKGWDVEEHFQSLLLEPDDAIQLEVGIRNLFSKKKKYIGKNKKDKDTSTENDSDDDEEALLEISLEDAIQAAIAGIGTGGTGGTGTPAAIVIAKNAAEGIAEAFGNARLKLTMGLISPLEFSGAGVYLDSMFATGEGQPVKACGLDPELGYYGLDPKTEHYSFSTNYIGNLSMGLDLLFGLHAFFQFNPLGITLWDYSNEIAAQSIPIIRDRNFALNFETDPPITFPVDVDKILESDSEFAREFQRSPQWHLTDGAKARLGGGAITAIAYAPDGCQLAVGGSNGSISLYNSNLGSGEKREFLWANAVGPYGIQSLSFNRDGTILASGGAAVMLWDVATGLIITELPHGNDVRSVHFSPDGTILASGSGKSGVKLWDVTTGTEIATLPHGNWRVRFSPDGKTLATAANSSRGRRGSVKLWNIVDGTPGQEITLPMGEHALSVTGIAFSPDSTILATADNYDNGGDFLTGGIGGGRVRLWDADTGTEIATLLQDEDFSDTVLSVAFSPDGKTLAAGGNNLYLWNVETRTEIARLPIVGEPLRDITFTPDGTTLSGVIVNSWRMRSWGVYRTPEKAILTEITTLGQARGHTKRVRFGPDSKTLVSFDNKGARLWDTDTGKEIRTLFHTESESLAGDLGDFSPDGTTFALVFSTNYLHDRNPEIGNLELWDAETRTRKRTLGSPTLPVESVAFSKNGKRIAGGRRDGVVVWDVETGEEIATLPYDHPVRSVALSPNGKILAGGDSNGIVKLWDVETEEEIATLPFKTDARFGAASLSFDPDNKMLAVGGSHNFNRSLSLWEAETGKHITTLDTLEGDIILSVAFSPDGKTLASSNRDGVVELWDVATEAHKTTFWASPEIREGVQSVHFSPDGKTLATAAGHGTVLLWDLTLINTGTEIATFTSDRQWTEDVDFSPDSKTLATAGEGDVYLWNIVDKLTLETTIQGVGAKRVRFSPDGETLAIGGGALKLWNIATNTEIATLTGHTHVINSVAFSPPDGKTLASGSSDGTVRLWDVDSRTLKATLTGHTHVINSVAFSRDGKTLASGSDDGTVRLWDITSETEIATLTEISTFVGYGERVFSVAFGRDGKTLASGSGLSTVRLWDVASRTVKVRLKHNYSGAQYTTVRFSPDGKTLASSLERNVVLWDVTTGAVKANLTADTATWLSICFSPDGKMLASGGVGYTSGTGGHIKLWDITSAVGSTTAPPLLVADVNGDGVVNIADLVAINSALLTEASGNNADVNQDGIINIADLILVAAAIATSEAAVTAAPAVLADQAAEQLTPADVQRWLIQAHAAKLTAATAKRGILFLEHLLSVLTPQKTALLPNYPNPFNPETWIPYQLSEPVDVTLKIYDIQGHVVRDLDLGHQRAGMYQHRSRAAYWDGKNAVGEPVASGVYFYMLKAGTFTATRKMLILK